MKYVCKSIFQLLSILFHPLVVIMYILILYAYVNPYLFPYTSGRDFGTIILITFFTAVMIPGISILLMLGTGFISSLQLHNRTERIGPLIVTSISYLWLYLNIRTHNAIPISFSLFVLGALISLFLAFFINNFSKISLHAVGMGGFLFGSLYLILHHGRSFSSIGDVFVNNIFLIVIILILTGAVLTSRLYLKAHTYQDVLGGLLVGIAGQLIALRFF